MSDKYTISLPVINECLSHNQLLKVTIETDIEIKRILENFASYFKQEMRFDHMQYDAIDHEENCIGFLFVTPALDMCFDETKPMPTRFYGGCCFYYENEKWKLSWVWLHPFFRNRRFLSNVWSKFKDEFGDFDLQQPLSVNMQSFLDSKKIRKTNYDKQICEKLDISFNKVWNLT